MFLPVTGLNIKAGIFVEPAKISGNMFFESGLVQLGLSVDNILQVIALQQAFVDSLVVLVFPELYQSVFQILLCLQGRRTKPKHS